MRWLLLFLLVPLSLAYTLVPPQDAALVRVWTASGSTMKYLEEPNVLDVSSPLEFVALDTDGNGIFDRGGVPDEEGIIALYPVGLLQGSVDEPTLLTVSCNYPSLRTFEIDQSFLIVLPAGECTVRGTQKTFETTTRATITANDITSLTLTFGKRSPVLLFVFVIVVLIIANAVWFVTRRTKKTGAPLIILSVLKPEERQVVEYLCSRGPQLAGVVRKDLAMPKTSFHRTLVRLREKKLVVEEEYGNTTKIAWNESFHSK